MPLVQEIRALHDGVPVGTEKQEFVQKRAELEQQLERVLRAKRGLAGAFNITSEELESYQTKAFAAADLK
jgi:hypothetical protein